MSTTQAYGLDSSCTSHNTGAPPQSPSPPPASVLYVRRLRRDVFGMVSMCGSRRHRGSGVVLEPGLDDCWSHRLISNNLLGAVWLRRERCYSSGPVDSAETELVVSLQRRGAQGDTDSHGLERGDDTPLRGKRESVCSLAG